MIIIQTITPGQSIFIAKIDDDRLVGVSPSDGGLSLLFRNGQVDKWVGISREAGVSLIDALIAALEVK